MIREGVILSERYEVRERIGAGGMADVYRGRDLKLNRLIAIKVLKREYREDDNFIRKFTAEAQSAAGLMHPNIVNVYDVGDDRGLYYMVMELVEGITLKEYIMKKGRLSPKEVISISIQMCNGIEAVHKHNIIHRDIKPQNIIISKEGKVKVTDFGIARVASSDTVSTSAMGSVHYTSPEQAKGGFSDVKSDIYSIGVSIYEMVTGEVPFDGESTVAIAVKHLQEEFPHPSELVSDIPYSLEQIILKCTQKSPDNRYQNAGFLIMDLKRALIDPNGNFVGYVPNSTSDTVMITPEEMSEIQNRAEEYDDDDYDEEYDDDDENYDDDGYPDDEYDDDYDDRRRKKGGKKGKNGEVNQSTAKVMKILTIVVAVIIVFVVVIMVGKAAGIFKIDPSTETTTTEANIKVPDLVGSKEAEAKTMLEKKGLKMKVVAREESTKYEKGVVAEQKTASGKKVKKGTEIEVVVSSKLVSEEVEIPDVVGRTESDAQQILTEKGFKVTTDYGYDDGVDSGDVISTNPASGTKAAKGSTITITISKGEESIKVPSLVGSTLEDAKSKLSDENLIVGNVTEKYDQNKAGVVISQGIASGRNVSKGTAVDLVVSKGPQPEEKLTVPTGLKGKTESDARKALENAGITYEILRENSDTVPSGSVISIDPAEGAQISKGTTVKITISQGSQSQGGTEEGQ